MCVYADKDGNIWVGTGGGLALFDPEEETFILFKDPEKRFSIGFSTSSK